MTKRVILAGGGHAHLAVLADWARRPLPDTERWLITSARHTAYSGMVPGWMAGFYPARDFLIDLKPLADRAGARLIVTDVTGLDAENRTIKLATGDLFEFDLLSLATGGESDTSSLAALGDKLLPVRPMNAFTKRWSGVLEKAFLRGGFHVCIVGGGAAGIELALAACASLRDHFTHARVSIVAPENDFLRGHAEGVRRRALGELERQGIAIHFAHAVGLNEGLLLSNGRFLPADCVIAATGSRAPRWLAKSRLACCICGFVVVGPDMRSVSHPSVFAAGDIVSRLDRGMERSGVHAVKAGPILAANLRAVVNGGTIQSYRPKKRTLYLLSTGDRRAILSWGPLVTSGRWVWRLKDWIDWHFVEQYRLR